MKVELRLPFPPRLSTYYGHNRLGRQWVSPKGVTFRNAVKAAIVDFKNKNKHIEFPFTGYCNITVRLVFNDLRDRDCDNYSKGLLDSLKVGKSPVGVVFDDSQFWVSTIIKNYSPDAEENFCIVYIDEMTKITHFEWGAEEFYAAKAKLAAKRTSSPKRAKKTLKEV